MTQPSTNGDGRARTYVVRKRTPRRATYAGRQPFPDHSTRSEGAPQASSRDGSEAKPADKGSRRGREGRGEGDVADPDGPTWVPDHERW